MAVKIKIHLIMDLLRVQTFLNRFSCSHIKNTTANWVLNNENSYFIGYTEYVRACGNGHMKSFSDLKSLMSEKVFFSFF